MYRGRFAARAAGRVHGRERTGLCPGHRERRRQRRGWGNRARPACSGGPYPPAVAAAATAKSSRTRKPSSRACTVAAMALPLASPHASCRRRRRRRQPRPAYRVAGSPCWPRPSKRADSSSRASCARSVRPCPRAPSARVAAGCRAERTACHSDM